MDNEVTFAEKEFFSNFNAYILGHLKVSVEQGTELANSCMDDNDFLKAFVGRRNRSQLQNTAIEFSIKNRAERFGLDLITYESNNSRGTFPHYKFQYGNSIFTVSRTTSYDAFPRDAKFRSMNANLNSQIELINKDDVFQIDNHIETKAKFYTILTFGGQTELDFMHMGIPNCEINMWLFQYNLANAIIPVQNAIPEREEIKEETVAAVKDEYIKRREVSGIE
ncbi:hypothetical protein NYE69_07065 [Paenibacillus sp. FSL R5-0527]|uniref:hypothetical protein n=1 Tax=Paenibacillus sp. FSL R5-0527 TaxID=2975321 RepID=UPI00097AD3E7|nr:hypothetical protein BK140_09465 [Paenibacillus macerans]